MFIGAENLSRVQVKFNFISHEEVAIRAGVTDPNRKAMRYVPKPEHFHHTGKFCGFSVGHIGKTVRRSECNKFRPAIEIRAKKVDVPKGAIALPQPWNLIDVRSFHRLT